MKIGNKVKVVAIYDKGMGKEGDVTGDSLKFLPERQYLNQIGTIIEDVLYSRYRFKVQFNDRVTRWYCPLELRILSKGRKCFGGGNAQKR